VLVNRQHVVTAGHCIKNKRIEALNVTLGEYNIGESLADGEIFPSQTFKVQAMVVHPKFQFSPAADRFDVAVLKLSSPVSYLSHIAPICLPQVGRDPEASIGQDQLSPNPLTFDVFIAHVCITGGMVCLSLTPPPLLANISFSIPQSTLSLRL
jgi:hypothetical protein